MQLGVQKKENETQFKNLKSPRTFLMSSEGLGVGFKSQVSSQFSYNMYQKENEFGDVLRPSSQVSMREKVIENNKPRFLGSREPIKIDNVLRGSSQTKCFPRAGSKESKEIFDRDWVRVFEKNSLPLKSFENNERNKLYQSKEEPKDPLKKQFKLTYLDNQNQRNTEKKIDQKVDISLVENNFQLNNSLLTKKVRIDINSNNKSSINEIENNSSIFGKLSAVLQGTTQIQMKKKEQQQIYSSQKFQDFDNINNPVAVYIPKSYLDSKGIGDRAQSEKQLQPQQNIDSRNVQQKKKDGQEVQQKKKVVQELYYITQVVKAFQQKLQKKINEIAKEHIDQFMQGVKFSLTNNLRHCINEKNCVFLPNQVKKMKTIIFDLDETLIHCNTDESSITKVSDVVLPITFPNGEKMQACINVRPYAQYILQNLSRHFEVIIFTASHSSYADVVIDYLDPQNRWISHRFYRDHCIPVGENTFIKDLRIIGNRKLSDMLIIDNSSYSIAYQLENGIPIIPYYDNKQDEVLIELRDLQKYLMQFKDVVDVRVLNNQLMKIKEFGSYQDAVDLLRNEFDHCIDD